MSDNNTVKSLLMAVAVFLLGWSWQGLPVPSAPTMDAGTVSAPVLLREGILRGTLGGLRSLLADYFWLRAYTFWEDKDFLWTNWYMELGTQMAPDNRAMWRNRIRVVSRDMPVWELQRLADWPAVSEELAQQVKQEHAQRGLLLLEQLQQDFPDEAEWWTLAGFLYEERLQNHERAVHCFLKAWQLGGEYVNYRMVVILWMKEERYAEAYQFLQSVYPQLPADLPRATKGLAAEWLRELKEKVVRF